MNQIKIAIHQKGLGFTKYWINYCKENNIDYRLVDAFDNNIVEEIKDCDLFLWHHDLLQKKDVIVAKRLLSALEHAGIKVFPSIFENWHYDDKIAQKYLLEAIQAPFIPSYVFVDKTKALEWIEETNFPKVAKLKGGAGSINVSLIHSKEEAKKYIYKAFSKGFDPVSRKYHVKEGWRKFKQKELGLVSFLKRIYRYFNPPEAVRTFVDTFEKDYVYFQDFIPNNDGDYRLVVINQEKVYGMKRFNRKGDFKASGSGHFEHLHPGNTSLSMLKVALDTARKLKMNSIAYDFVWDSKGNPLIIEITYAYGMKSSKARGYWDSELNWHERPIKTMDWILNKQIDEISNK